MIFNDPNLTLNATKEIKEKSKSFLDEFLKFLEEYKVMGLAVAFIMGAAAKDFVTDIVEGLVMPVITFFIPGGAWESATFTIGRIVIQWGRVLSGAISFFIMAVVVFAMAKFVLGQKEVKKI